MGVAIKAWRGGRNLVTATGGAPRLWLTKDGDLCDVLGQQVAFQGDDFDNLGDLLLFVAEWLYCVAHSDDGRVAYCDIHPDIRASLYEFVPSAIELSDDDEVAFILS